MLIKRNVGNIDAAIRAVLACLFIYFGFIRANIINDVLFTNILGFSGLIILLSSIYHYCPLYLLAGVKTLLKKQRKVHSNLVATKIYFLVIFTLLSITTMIIFSFAAFHTAGDLQKEREAAWTQTLFQRQADYIQKNANVDALMSLRQTAMQLHGFSGHIFATDGYFYHPLTRGQRELISITEIQRLTALLGQSGFLEDQHQRRYWHEIALHKSRFRLFFVVDIDKPEVHIIDAFGARMLVAGCVLFYFYIWGVLIGTRYIAKKFEKLNAARQESEAFNTLLLNSTAEAIYGVNTEGNCTFCNAATLSLLGYTDSNDLLGKNVHLLMHHSHADGSEYPIFDCPMTQVFKQGIAVHRDDEVFWRSDNTNFPVEYWGHPIHQHNRISGMVMTFLDISERKQAELEMRKLSSVVEQAKDLIILTDNQGMVSYANPMFTIITGLDRNQARGQHIAILNQILGEADEIKLIMATLEADKIFQDSFINHRNNGEPYYLNLSAFGLKNVQGEIESIVYSGRDMTEQFDIEESIRKSDNERIEAEAANQSKSMFLANMSHEIRTPMTAIMGFAETLSDDSISPQERKDAVATIIRGGRHLIRIINDILDLSKIEANRIDIESIPVDLFWLMHELEIIIEIQAQQRNIQFTIDYALPLPKQIHSDPTRLKQILLNLLTNAVKFTNQGSVRATLSYDAAQQSIQFEVKDSGIGLSQDQLRKLFSPFAQAKSSTTRQYGGTGLGLHISKQLAEKMGGAITVQSEEQQGSTFTLSISSGIEHALQAEQMVHDLAQISLPVMDHIETENFVTASARILLSEDSKVSQALILRLFKDSGVDVTIVDNGKTAVEEAFKQEFDLVLTDIHMPIMDGLEATKKMRDKGFAKPIIAITANVMIDDIQSYHNAGCDAVIPKPVDKQEFFRVINRYLSASLKNRYEPKGQQELVIPKLSGEILLAEDNPDNQRLLTLLVEKTGANLTITENGLSAIEHTLSKDYHLILMDINMPLMDGLKATKKLRNAGYTLPIIALTADTDADRVQQFEAAGYDGYLSKPLDKHLFFNLLKKYLPLTAHPPKVAEAPPAQLAHTPDYDNIDDGMLELMALFAEKLPPMIEQTQSAIDQKDWESAAAIIHNIKGTAGSFGHPALTELAGELSDIFKREDYTQVDTAFSAVKNYAQQVKHPG